MPKQAPEPIDIPDHAWTSPVTVAACQARDANTLFRLAHRHGVNNERLSYWTGIDPGEISRRLNNKNNSPVQTLDRWERIADGLGMPDQARVTLGIAPHGPSGQVSHAAEVASRPQSAAASSTKWRSGLPVPSRSSLVDPHLPATLLDLLAQYARTDNLLGPRSLLLAVTSQLALVEQLWKVAREPVRSQLFEVGARYAEFAGWLHQDAGDSPTAARWTQQALELAHAANSPVLAAYVLMRRSNQASSVGDGAHALGLATASLQVPEAGHPRLQALALRQRARGHALDGNDTECERALEEARRRMASASVEPDPLVDALAGYCTTSYVEMEAADCWVLLGRPERAVPIFETQLATWPEVYRRDRAVHLARLASAYAACGRTTDAEQAVSEALAMAEEIGSSRVVDELGRSLDRLDVPAARPRLAPVRERLAALTASGPAA